MKTLRHYSIIGLAAFAIVGTSSVAVANGLGENRAWQFRTPNERAVQIQELELRLLEDSGFFDPRENGGAGGGGSGDTIIYGDQYNCTVSSVTTGNEAANANDGITGTLMGVTGSSISATGAGNTSSGQVDVDGRGTGTIDGTQTNDGTVTADVDGSGNSSSVGSFQGGGATHQALNSHQSVANSTLTSSAQGTVSCDRIYN